MQQSYQNRKDHEDHGKDDPALGKIMERNIRTEDVLAEIHRLQAIESGIG